MATHTTCTRTGERVHADAVKRSHGKSRWERDMRKRCFRGFPITLIFSIGASAGLQLRLHLDRRAASIASAATAFKNPTTDFFFYFLFFNGSLCHHCALVNACETVIITPPPTVAPPTGDQKIYIEMKNWMFPNVQHGDERVKAQRWKTVSHTRRRLTGSCLATQQPR